MTRLGFIALALAVGVHAAFFVALFVLRAPEPATPKTAVVTVLHGHVDPMTGDFLAEGMAQARVRR